jgi:hypothetical protein
MRWTVDHVLAWIKDPATMREGQRLAEGRGWLELGSCREPLTVVWGECAGTARKPYRVQINLGGATPAAHCTCPSRKNPCKHAAGLLLRYNSQPDSFPEAAPPSWVLERLAPPPLQTPNTRVKTVNDPVARARRAGQREAKVSAGIAEIDRWLLDLARGGIAGAAAQPPDFWEAPAARMVDAQAPGLARRLRLMARMPGSGPDWPDRLLEAMGRLRLVVAGYARREALPADLYAELRAQIGWSERQEDVLARTGVQDRWLVCGVREVPDALDPNLRERRVWLTSALAGQCALYIEYAFRDQGYRVHLPVGGCIEAELCFYAGALPLRAAIREPYRAARAPAGLPGARPSITTALDVFADALARNPWLERLLLVVAGVSVVQTGDLWAVRDAAGDLLPLTPDYPHPWRLVALGGGHPVAIAGEWDGHSLWPLSMWADGRLTEA